MKEDLRQLDTERDFIGLVDRLANGIRGTDWGQATDDISECLYGMIDYLDSSSDPTSPRDGLKWSEIGAMILEGLEQTKTHQSVQRDED